jgi:flavin reductase (DIM6/NTAB) family NADH-FMN oxidoreductase RutF/DNA-binding IclR family transcriptional regulator
MEDSVDPISDVAPQIDARYFRDVLGHFPTGVCVITAMGASGEPIGMVVGTFASVSLDPPLVAFMPDRSSTTFPRIREAGRFCVNVLSSGQEPLCRSFSTRGADRFGGIDWTPAPITGSPVLPGSVAWIDCIIDVVHEAGDHDIVIGRVQDLAVQNPGLPLLFYQGGYGVFTLPSLVVASREGISRQVHLAEVAREPMEELAQQIGVECRAVAADGDRLVIVATAGSAAGVDPVGAVIPFSPPFGSALVAWAGDEAMEAWLNRYPIDISDDVRLGIESDLARLRRDGWYLSADAKMREGADLILQISRLGRTPRLERALWDLGSRVGRLTNPDDLTDVNAPEVQVVSAPIFDKQGEVVLQLTLYGFPPSMTRDSVLKAKDALVATASEISATMADSA